jgi:hypothetical protein
VSSLAERGQRRAEEYLRRGVDVWVAEGHIGRDQGDALLASLRTPAVAQALVHLGVHFAISIPLRFPLGASARFLYTLTLRLRAEVVGLLHRSRPTDARRLHTPLVMLVGLLPGFGRLAYFFSPALAGERLFILIPSDQVARKLPFRAYERFHLDALFVYWASPDGPDVRLRPLRLGSLVARAGARLTALGPYLPVLAAILAVETVVFLIGAYIYVDSNEESIWWFDERGVVAWIDVVQLVFAGGAGILAYRAFWQRPGWSKWEAAGIFLWGIGGVGLIIFAVDDFISFHESIGDRARDLIGFLPNATNSADDLLVIGYAVVGVATLVVFRMELVAPRDSATFLALAAAASIVMVLTDAFAHARALKAVELPAQTLAATLLMFAFVSRYREVRRHSPAVDADGVPGLTLEQS